MESENAMPMGLFVFSVVAMTLTGLLAADRPLTPAEAIALQVIAHLSSFVCAYLVGQNRAFATRLRPAARSAFRRLKSLYAGLSRIAHIVESRDISGDRNKLEIIREVTRFHILTSDDALQDWSDLDPDGVSELRSVVQDHVGEASDV